METPSLLRAGALAVLALTLSVACATSPSRGPGLGAAGDGCRVHADCGPGLLCGDEEGRCLEDECASDDDCDAASVGQSRCAVVDGAPAVQRCGYDGYRCLEWTGEVCPLTAHCAEDGAEGAVCRDPDGGPAVDAEESNAPEDEAEAAGP